MEFSQVIPFLENAQSLVLEITKVKLAVGLLILILAYFGILASQKFINWISEQVPRQYRILIKQSLPLGRAGVLIVATALLLSLFVDFSASNLLAVTGGTVVALGFAFKDYVSSVIAGIVALFEAPYRVGDRIQIGEYYGEVVNYGLRGIRLATPDDEIITIPHINLWTEAIINTNNGQLEAQIETTFYLDATVNVEKVINILYQAAYTSKYSQIKLPIFVSLEEKPWGTAFQLESYVMDARDEIEYKTDLIKRAKQAFAEADLKYPQFTDYRM
ncbi:MAG: mechanosensitive ion channel family protein [Chroococcales cyanobacterium]